MVHSHHPPDGRQKKRRKRSIEGSIAIDGFHFIWRLRSEPQASSEGWEGLSISVERADGVFRELILEYPFPKTKNWPMWPFPLRPKVSQKSVEASISQAMAAGWNPSSRGKAFTFEVPESSN